MLDGFFDTIAKVTKSLGFPLMVFDVQEQKMLSLDSGVASLVDVPSNIQSFLHDEDVFVNYFSKGNKLVVIYFLRVKVTSKKYVFVVNDSKKRARLNRFLYCLLAAVDKLTSEHVRMGKDTESLRQQLIEAQSQASRAIMPTSVDYSKGMPSMDTEKILYLEHQVTEYRQKVALLERMVEDAEHKAALVQSPDFDATKSAGFSTEVVEQKNRQLQLKDEIISQKDLQLDRKEHMLKEARRDLAVKEALLAQRLEELGLSGDAMVEKEQNYQEAMAVLEEKDTEISELNTLLNERKTTVLELEKSLKDANARSEEADNFVKVMKHSRDKMMNLMDGLVLPLFAMNPEYKVVSANRKGADFAGKLEFSDLVDKPCHKEIYGLDAPCEWCRLHEVKEAKQAITQGVEYKVGKTLAFDHTMFPIFDEEGNVVEVGEFIVDTTERFEMVSSLDKYRDQVRKFKKARIDDLTEMSEIKNAYEELSRNYDIIFDRNQKMMKVIERLVSEDQAAELLKARTEMADLRNKLQRAMDGIKNYRKALEDQEIRYSDLNKRTFFQMERLINILKNKVTVRNEDAFMVLDFLSKEFEGVKKTFLKDQARQRAAEEAQQEEIMRLRQEEMEKEAKVREDSLRRQAMAQGEVDKKRDKLWNV